MALTPGNQIPWKITQITPNPLSLEFWGPNAPHGRPRHGGLVKDKIELRRSSTYYPGSNRRTHHTFGVKYHDWNLRGRWMDSNLGPGGAQILVQQMREIVKAAIPCTVEWGNVLVVTGLPVEFEAEWESNAEAPWTLVIEIDTDDTKPVDSQPVVAQSPTGQIDQILKKIESDFATASQKLPSDVPLQIDFLEALDNIVSIFTTLTGQLASLASNIDSFEKASALELQRMRGIIGQLNTAAATISNMFDDASNDFGVSAASGNSQLTYCQQRAQMRLDAIFMAAILAALDDQAQQALAGKVNTTYRAKLGDTWESISIALYGSIDNADDLRQANNARGGTLPQAGRIVHIPKP